MLMAMGDHGSRWLVSPAETAVLVVPTRHAQDCGACFQGSRVELYACYQISLKTNTLGNSL